MRRALAVSAVVALAVAAGCGGSAAVADDPNNSSVKIADNDWYATWLDKHTFDGHTVTCLVKRGDKSLTMSCDWSPK